jgi:ribosomal protein S27AE
MSFSPRRTDRGNPPLSADAEPVEETSSSARSAPKNCPHCAAKLVTHADGERFHCDACGCCFLKNGELRPGHAACKPAADAAAAEAEVAAAKADVDAAAAAKA